MLGRLLKRQIQSSMVYTSSGYVDSLGRVGRFFEGNWAGAYVDQNTALGIPAIYRGITLTPLAKTYSAKLATATSGAVCSANIALIFNNASCGDIKNLPINSQHLRK